MTIILLPAQPVFYLTWSLTDFSYVACRMQDMHQPCCVTCHHI